MEGRPFPNTPCLDMAPAVVCLLLNLFVATGLGTVVAVFATGERGVARGVAQFFLDILIVGWVWGIITGVQMVRNAAWKRAGVPRAYPA